ncbi:hypothetical protein WISP_35607 [Willisornis vidua]|uniref:Uncharacterized protein n=1 Tax=Willisornis vidua TaxID=1566151 RepID=A0ABQ9DIP7_9PASS|nr:hypothetical protein WISP_35607 [Willisornis vidua]
MGKLTSGAMFLIQAGLNGKGGSLSAGEAQTEALSLRNVLDWSSVQDLLIPLALEEVNCIEMLGKVVQAATFGFSEGALLAEEEYAANKAPCVAQEWPAEEK